MSKTDKFARLEALIRADHTVEEVMYEDMGGADIAHYCAGCGADLDEQECPYLAILDEKPTFVTGPHSRACGWREHQHGSSCHTNCPTCGGKQ